MLVAVVLLAMSRSCSSCPTTGWPSSPIRNVYPPIASVNTSGEMLILRDRISLSHRPSRPASGLLWSIIPSRFCVNNLQYFQSIRLARRHCWASSASFRTRRKCRSSRLLFRNALFVIGVSPCCSLLHFPDVVRKLAQGMWLPSHSVLHVVRKLCVPFWPQLAVLQDALACSKSSRRS